MTEQILRWLSEIGIDPTLIVLLWLLYDQQQRINALEGHIDRHHKLQNHSIEEES